MTFTRSLGRRRLLLSLTLAVALIGGTTAIAAALSGPSNPGPFTGCLSRLGILYGVKISPATPTNCTGTDTPIAFSNAQGPKGDPGAPGTNGTNGTNGKDGAAGTSSVACAMWGSLTSTGSLRALPPTSPG